MRRCVVMHGPITDEVIQRYGLSNTILQTVNGVVSWLRSCISDS